MQAYRNENKKTNNFIFDNFFLCFSCPLNAQVTGVLFLQQAISSALQNNPELQLARGNLEAADLEIIAEANLLNPFFIFDADTGDKIYRFGLQKAFETGRPGRIRRKIGQKQKALRRAQLEVRIIEVEERVIDAFTDVFINQERIKLLEDTFSFIKTEQEEAEDLSEVNQLLVEEELLDILQGLEDAKIEVEKAKLVLAGLLGKEVSEETDLGNPRELKVKDGLTKEKLIEIALKKKPEIIENDMELELAQTLRELAKANYWPLIIADAGAEVDFEEENAGFFIGVDIELPVLGIEKRQIMATDRRIEQIKKGRKILEKNLKLEISEAYELYEFTRKRLEDYEDSYLPKKDELISIIRQKYEDSEISFMDLLKAEKSKLRIQNNYFDALFDFEDAFSNLEKAVGISLTESKPEVNIPKEDF